ncbi:Rasa2 protein [Thecamonas trahens ATCC 50062]|uniref:Rasa2 protein n=1 Tax=Thecamonas trahens ATCC 50062 TaxID=461836 RepID=A0A0L0DNR1_THETB|nr:Rasa2 protein [Thecamonas trahens ATCC 50062]KNC53949.1 Rasa2 protein [Thecamonas trahens ATCC 50062]|eukprot:XP_013754152.1 Rasa2 protein [Thecamonas trahens ATCC 50062]
MYTQVTVSIAPLAVAAAAVVALDANIVAGRAADAEAGVKAGTEARLEARLETGGETEAGAETGGRTEAGAQVAETELGSGAESESDVESASDGESGSSSSSSTSSASSYYSYSSSSSCTSAARFDSLNESQVQGVLTTHSVTPLTPRSVADDSDSDTGVEVVCLRVGRRASSSGGAAGLLPSRRLTPSLPVYAGPLYVRAQRLLHLRVAEGRNLKGGKSTVSSYCNVHLGGGLVVRTQTVHKTSEPTYGEEFNFELPLTWEPNVEIDVFETGSRRRDAFLGRVLLNSDKLAGSSEKMMQEWLPLELPTVRKRDFVSGSMHVTIRHAPFTEATSAPGTLEIRIGEARNLTHAGISGPCKPFIRVDYGGEAQTSTPMRAAASVAVFFGDAFTFVTDRTSRSVIVSVWHAKKLGTDDFMGEVSVDLRALEPHVAHAAWYSLRSKYYATPHAKLEAQVQKMARQRRCSVTSQSSPPPSPPPANGSGGASEESGESEPSSSPRIIMAASDDIKLRSAFGLHTLGSATVQASSPEVSVRRRALAALPEGGAGGDAGVDGGASEVSAMGDLRVKYEFSEVDILPLDAYEPLLATLEEEEGAQARWVMAYTRNRDAFARSLMLFLGSVLADEIEATPNTGVLFRGNSLGSKAVDMYMKIVGKEYLASTLKPVLDAMYASDGHFEIDNARAARDGTDWQDNLVRLNGMIRLAVDSVLGSLDAMPLQLRFVFAALANAVAAKFPDKPGAPLIAVSGFLFLRFFCPAVMGPKVFGLADAHPGRPTARGLVLIAKTLQCLANLVRFGDKEKCMSHLNPLVDEYDGPMRAFLAAAATVPSVGDGSSPTLAQAENFYAPHESALGKDALEYQAALVHKELAGVLRSLEPDDEIIEMWPGKVKTSGALLMYTRALLVQMDKIRVQAKTLAKRRERGLSVWHAQEAAKQEALHNSEAWSAAKAADLARIRETLETGARFVYADFTSQSLYWEPVAGKDGQVRAGKPTARIAFADILDVVRGHTTVAFKKSGKRGREFVAFSVVAVFCTLDLEADDEAIREAWFSALSFVVREIETLAATPSQQQ